MKCSVDHGRSPFVQKNRSCRLEIKYSTFDSGTKKSLNQRLFHLALVGCEGLVPSWLESFHIQQARLLYNALFLHGEKQGYSVNKSLPAAGISEDNARG